MVIPNPLSSGNPLVLSKKEEKSAEKLGTDAHELMRVHLASKKEKTVGTILPVPFKCEKEEKLKSSRFLQKISTYIKTCGLEALFMQYEPENNLIIVGLTANPQINWVDSSLICGYLIRAMTSSAFTKIHGFIENSTLKQDHPGIILRPLICVYLEIYGKEMVVEIIEHLKLNGINPVSAYCSSRQGEYTGCVQVFVVISDESSELVKKGHFEFKRDLSTLSSSISFADHPNVTATSVHPGTVYTNIMSNLPSRQKLYISLARPFITSLSDAGANLVRAAECPLPGGMFYQTDGVAKLPELVYSDKTLAAFDEVFEHFILLSIIDFLLIFWGNLEIFEN